MKKILSIILALAMVMSLLCVVPAFAASDTNAIYYYKLPYMFEDFEGRSCFFQKGSSIEDTSRGGRVRQLTESSGNNTDRDLQSAYYGDNVGYQILHPFRAGDRFTISFWVKVGNPMNSDASMEFILYSGSSWRQLSGKISDPTNTTTYQKVSVSYTFDVDFTTTGIKYRPTGTTKDGNNIVYYVDDFEMKIDSRGGETENYSITHGAAENEGTANKFNKYATTEFDQAVSPVCPENGDGLARKITYQEASGDLQPMLKRSNGVNMSFSEGQIVRVSQWVKLTQEANADTLYYVISFGTTGKGLSIPFSGNTTDWQKIEGEMVVDEDISAVDLYHNYSASGSSNKYIASWNDNRFTNADGTYPAFYVDNYSFKIYTPSEGSKYEPSVVNATAEHDGTNLEFDYTLQLPSGRIIDASEDTSTYKFVGVTSGRVYGSYNVRADVAMPATALAADEDIYLEIVPVYGTSATFRYIGDACQILIQTPQPIVTGINDIDGNIVTVTSDAARPAVIFLASYKTVNGKKTLVNAKYAEVSLVVGEHTYTVDGFIAGDCDSVRAFLWGNLTSIAPICQSLAE